MVDEKKLLGMLRQGVDRARNGLQAVDSVAFVVVDNYARTISKAAAMLEGASEAIAEAELKSAVDEVASEAAPVEKTDDEKIDEVIALADEKWGKDNHGWSEPWFNRNNPEDRAWYLNVWGAHQAGRSIFDEYRG